jgi:hypothetical protein
VRVKFASQYGTACVHLDGDEEIDGEGLVNACRNAKATYDDGEGVCFVIAFPERPQELYTEEALRGSMKSDCWRRSQSTSKGVE